MVDPHLLPEPSKPQNQTPLLTNPTDQTQQQQQKQEQNPEPDCDTHLDKTLQRLESFLSLLGFNQSSVLSFVLSWVAFLLIGVALPVIALEVSDCSGCEAYQIKDFELEIVVSQACLAAVSLLCLSHNLRKYGIRKFLFVDRYSGQMARFRDEYIRKVLDTAHYLVWWILPCFILKTAREIARILYGPHESWWLSVAILLALIISWIYVTTIYLFACILFHLVCNLQIIHFDDYGKCLEKESDVMVLIEEHIRLRHHLSKISHRFRIYLLLVFLVVTASQFVTLFQSTGYSGPITFTNGGDFAVSSVVQVVGIILCLNAAAKISHRAQGVASLASRWHAAVTCSSPDASQLSVSNSVGSLEAANALRSLYIVNSESDLESLDYIPRPTNTQLASYMSSYHKRQSFAKRGLSLKNCTCQQKLADILALDIGNNITSLVWYELTPKL
ncbi:uncharacterized protein LOC114258047 isoform X2 [Camellia sinensis]|uniref:uncharacterized protein LOC114258047 isoform X2 n=1 Tax=Camellia sinensis TaxID=4442 RepID=UPI001035C833|nr:uncharacterized protein LOC114258047 isoform X2 [Camellia sinensis]